MSGISRRVVGRGVRKGEDSESGFLEYSGNKEEG